MEEQQHQAVHRTSNEEVLGLVCASLTDVRTVCAALCTSSSARQAILAKCSGTLLLQIDTNPVLASSVAFPIQAALTGIIDQTAWVAQYGQLVGQLHLRSANSWQAPFPMEGAEETAMQAMLKVLPQLQQLQLEVSRPATVLKLLQSSSLTRLQVLEQPDYYTAPAAASTMLAPALRQLTGLRELAISGYCYWAHNSIGPALAGLPHLTRLVLQPQLPPAVLGQLPSQLEELQLAHPACDAVQLSQQTQALQRLRSLTLMYSVPRLGRQHVLRHAPAWASIAALRCLHLQLYGESCELCPALAAAVAGATALKQLTAVFPYGVAHDVDVVAMLSPLRQLEGLELRLATVAPVETLQGLLSQQLTRLQSLTLELVPLRQLVLSQVCLQAMQLTQLVLARADMSGDRLDMLEYSMVQLRRLALCYCNLSAGDVLCSGVVRAVSPPRLPSLQQLAVVEVGCSAEAVVGIKQGVGAQRPSLAVAVVTDTRYLPSGFVGKEPDSDRPGLVFVEH